MAIRNRPKRTIFASSGLGLFQLGPQSFKSFKGGLSLRFGKGSK